MKYYIVGLTLILFLISAHDLHSQIIPNQGFENWITFGQIEDPEFWITNNAVNSISVSKSSNSHSGSFAIRVINNGPSFEGPLPGYAITSFSSPNIIYSISGFVKCDSIIGTGEGRIKVFGYTGTSIQQIGSWQTDSTITQYTPINILLNPLLVFDSIQVQIEAFSQMDPLGFPTGHVSLLVDDLVEYILSDGEEMDFSKYFRLSPNPFTDFVAISKINNLQDKIYIEIFDISGKLVYHGDLLLGSNNSVISTKNWPTGQYLFVFHNSTTNSIKSLSAIKM